MGTIQKIFRFVLPFYPKSHFFPVANFLKFCIKSLRVESQDQRSESDQPRCDIIKTKSKTNQQLLLEIKQLRTRLDATERRLQEAKEILQAQIAERKRGEQTFEKAQKYTESIVETIREPLLVLASDLRVLSANRSFYDTFKVTPKETTGNLIYNLACAHRFEPAIFR